MVGYIFFSLSNYKTFQGEGGEHWHMHAKRKGTWLITVISVYVIGSLDVIAKYAQSYGAELNL